MKDPRRVAHPDQLDEGAVAPPVPVPPAAVLPPPQASPIDHQARGAANVMALQRTAGNRAVTSMLAREGLISTGEAAANWRRAREARPGQAHEPGTCFRLPSAGEIKAIMAAKEVPEAKLKESIETALTRMARDKELKSADPIADIMKKLFPKPGTFDEAEFAKVVDTGSRSKIYQKAADAEAKLTPAHKAKLLIAMADADKFMSDAAADAANLKLVFGTRAADAKANYGKAKAALAKLKGNIDTNVHTDYNLDDDEIGLGGWAKFASQTVHLEPDVAAGKNPVAAAVTVLHECMHLADPAILDEGNYYPKSAKEAAGWDSLPDDQKVNNAAHYEEIPHRHIGISVFKAGQEFKPGVSAATGAAVTFEDKVRKKAQSYVRKAWDAAVDAHLGLRGVRMEIEKGSDALFKAHEALILEISKIAKLTIHDQKPAPKTVNLNDVVLLEGVAKATSRIEDFLPKQAVPAAPAVGKTEDDYAQEVVAGATKDYGALLGNPADDKKLLDWMVAHYGAVGF